MQSFESRDDIAGSGRRERSNRGYHREPQRLRKQSTALAGLGYRTENLVSILPMQHNALLPKKRRRYHLRENPKMVPSLPFF